ncbi:intermembrane lipid transfer protein VPS13C-like isoform X4 [Mytilus californianus]|uniref:intermembrane lipid transfer protein VPS13C-like isoform X4 n=1 Tax=Mytilus californianus TaxID=6549 RepID=UPI0022464150|nr:intermembrane lipid transfer protein VPS13C-like isoform X4 [Mytilus californianus]
MIKNKLDEIIKTYLGKYLDYDKDKIEYSLLQGKVELKDVSLRPEAIVELLTLQLGKEFPLEVKAGQVEYVKIAIPWSNLLGTSTEVTLELSGLYIIAGPVADRPYDKKKDEDLSHAIKQAKLRSFEETAYQKVASQAEKNPGLFEKIWKYVLNNITITVSNIHVRYEDSITHGDYSFAMGGILNQFTVHTTDKNWQETELDSQATLLHKLGKLTNLSLYWNHCVKDLDLVGKPERIKSGKWKDLLKMAVSTNRIRDEEFEHILKPVSVEAKIIMNNTDDLQMPKLYIQFSPPESCKCIDCYLSRRQYISMLKWFDAVDRLRVNMKYRKYRPNPNVRPVSNAKSWWKYAYQSVLQERIRPFSWPKIVVYRQQFKDYKHLYLQHLENPNDENITKRCKDLEYEMDVHNIMTAREDAKVEFQRRAPERAKRKKKEKSEGSWWWPWGGSQESEEEIETPDKDGIWGELSEVEKKELYDKIGYKEEADQQKLPDDYIAYKIQLEIKQFDVTLSSNRRNILKASLCEMLTSYENRPEGKGVRILSKTEGFKIEGATLGFKPFTILTSNGGLYTTDKQMFMLDYYLNPLPYVYKADQALILNVRPVEIFYDEHAVTQVLSFFQTPDKESEVDLNEIAMAKLRGFVEYSRDTLLYAIDQKSTFHISVHMKSPYIVIPQTGTLSDSEREGHVLVIDLGTFTVRSDLQDKSKSLENPSTEELHEKLYDKFLVTITEVEILVADSNEDWHLPLTMDRSQSKYHILPNSSLEIAFYKTSMSDNYNHPHHKFDIKLHSLTLTVTDEQLLILYMFVFHFPKPRIIALEDQMDSIGTVPPKLDPTDIQLEPDITLLRRTRRTILSRTMIEATIPEDDSVADRPYYPRGADENFFSASDDSEDEYDKWNRFLSVRSVEDYLSDNNRMRMYIRIQIVELVIQLSLQQEKQRKEYLMFRLDPVIVDMASTMYLDKNGKPVDCGYAMYASVGAFKMADKLHQRIVVIMKDSVETRASGAYLELLRTESDKKLITFSYRQVLPKCPDFGKVYNYIENAASFTCHNVSVIFDQTVMGSLKKFADSMQERFAKLEEKVNSGPNLRILDVNRPAPPTLHRQESRLSNYTNQVTGMLKGMADEVDSSDKPTIKLHLVTCIKDVSLQLCNIDKHFSQMEFKGFESQLIMKHRKIVFNCRLKEMSIKDLTKYTLYPNILIIEKEDDPFFDLKVEKFSHKDKIVKKDDNIGEKLDYRVRLRIGHLQLAYISKFFWEITGFFDPFKTPEIVEAAHAYRDMVSKQVTEIHPSAMRIAVRVSMHRPTIVIPKHSKSPDIFMFQFRMFEIDNSFKKEVLSNGQEQDWNYFIAHLKEMEVRRGRLKENEFHMLYHIVEPVNFEATFGLALAPFRSRLMYNISGDVALIKINVQQSDIKLMFDVLRKNLKEGAPQSVQDVGSSPLARVDVVDSPTTDTETAYNALVTLQGLTLCLFDEKTDIEASPLEIYHRNRLSLCKIGELNIRVNTFPEDDIAMDVNITLHSLSLDDTKSDSNPVVKRIFYCHQVSQQENLPLISVVYKARSSGHQEADIRMDKVTINLNIPYLLALNEFYQSAFQSDVPPIDQSRQRTSLVSDQLDSSPNNSVLQVKGIVKQPKIVLFADPEKDTSRILVLDTDIEFEMYTDSSVQKIQASIKSMKMYTSLHGSELYENSVIKPCNLDFSRISSLNDNKTHYSIALPQLDIYITPTVLHLMADVTKLLTGPEKKENDTSIEPVPETDMWSVKAVSADKWRARIDEEGSAIDPFVPAEAPTESITLKIKKMNSYFRVRNLDYDVDLLHLKMSIDATISDLQKQFQMTSDIQMEARYFNEKLSVWEPLIEKVSEKEGQYRPWECVMKVIRNRSYPMTFNYVQDEFSLEDTYRNNVQKLLQESKRRSSSSESETDDSIVEKTVMRHKFPRTRSRIASDKSFESLSHQGSIQGESDTEPDGLIQSITNKLGGIFSDSDSSEDADISENDDNGDLVDPSLDKPVFITSKGPVHIAMGNLVLWASKCCDPSLDKPVFITSKGPVHIAMGNLVLWASKCCDPSLDKPVFITSKGPVHIAMGNLVLWASECCDPSLDKPVFITSKGPVHIAMDQSMYDELDAGPQSDMTEEGEKEEPRPQSYYIIMASQDQLLLNITPQAIDVLTDVTKAMMTPEAVEGESKSRPAFEISNQLGLHTSVVLHPDIKVHENHIKKCQVLRQGKDDNQVKIVLRDENDERIDLPDIKEECSDDVDGLFSRSDDFVTETLAAFGNMVTSSGAFVFDDDPDYLSGDKMDINRLKVQVDGFDLSSTIFHKRACLQLFPLTPDKHSTKYWYLLHIDVVHGSKVIKIMSPFKMENSLTFAVDVYCKTEDLKQYGISVTYIELGQYSKLQTLQPGQEFVIPLFLAYNSDLFVAPTDLRGYQIHNNGIWWKDIQRTKERAKTYTCTGGNEADKVFNIKVYLADGKKLTPRQEVPKGVPYFTLVLKPPVLIHNYLPYDLQFSLEGAGKFSSLTHGESTPLYTVETSKSYKLHLQLQDYLGCDWTGIFELVDSQNLEEFKAVTMTSYDGMDENANKHLALIVNASVKMSLDLYIYSPYWIINKTDLPILIRGSNSDAVYDCTQSSADSSVAPSILFRFKKHKRKKAKLKVYESKWSQSFSMDTVGNSGVVICYDKERKIKYRLLLQCQWSHLKLSRIVTITPFFLVINKSSYHLWYMEKNEEKDLWLDLKKNQCSPFWPCTDNGKLCVRYDNSNISSSYIPINTVCNTVLRMENGRAMCVNVTGGIESPRSITFTDYDIGDSPVRIENLCEDVFIVIHQCNQHQMTVLGADQSVLYTWDEPAGTRKLMWNVYGGSNKQDLELDITKDSYDCKNLTVQQVPVADTYRYKDQSNRIDSSPDDDSDVIDTVDSPKHQAKMKTKSYKMTIYWVSFLDGQQRVVLFTCDKQIAEAARLMTEGEQANYVFMLSLSGIGVSIINRAQEEVAYVSISSMPSMWEIEVKNKWKMLEDVTLVTWLEDKWNHAVEHANLEDRIEVDFSTVGKLRMMKPYMGELRRVCPPGLLFHYSQSEHQTFIHAKVHKVQVDNQLLDAYFQTALYSSPIPMYIVKKKGPKPFLEFGMIRRRVPENNIDTFRQFQIIMQELNVQLDWGFIVSIQDVFSSLFKREKSEDMLTRSERLRSDLLLAQRPLHEIADVMASSLPNRIFFEFFKISPVKLNVSFSLSGTPHTCGEDQPSLASDIKEFLRNSVGATLTEIKDNELKMVHFEQKGLHITRGQMWSLAVAHYRQQLMMQLYVIILGLDVLGNPYGLFKDLTTGVSELFYEPVMDTLRGDENFSENMARGFQSAISHIVGGTSNSVARVTGSLGNAFAYMSFDEEFQRKRQRRQHQPPRDLPHSLALAGQGFLSGIKYGLTGIVLDPIHGATEDGVEGFFKGIGKGLLGLITQPIGGVLDLVSMAFDGVRRTAEMDGGFIVRMRLPRYVNPYRGLQPFSQYMARGCHLLNTLKGGMYFKTDVFIDFAPLSYNDRADLVVITNRHILYLDRNRFSSGYDVEWEIELRSIIGVPALLDEDKKIVITLKDNTGTVFSGNHVEVSSQDSGIIKWLHQKIENVLKQQIYR